MNSVIIEKMEIIKNLVLFALLLSIIVSVHEFGHLVAAKIFGVYFKEYSIGMGPKIFSKKGKETEYCIRALPVGGFVAMAGDTDNQLETSVDTTDIPFERTLPGIAVWKRIIVMLAGIFMNLILAILIYSMLILHNGQYVTSSKPEIVSVVEGSPAEKAGIQEGDIVTHIGFSNGLSISPESYRELISFTSTYDGNGPWTVEVERGSKTVELEIYPEYYEDEDRYMIGIAFSDKAMQIVDVNIFNCWKFGIEYAIFIVKLTWSSFISLFRGMNLSSVSGPIGIYSTVSEAASMGIDYYVQLIALISINVGIVNALPLPIFDGGRVLLALIELVLRKPLNKKAQDFVMTASLIILLLLFFFVTYNDVSKLIGGR